MTKLTAVSALVLSASFLAAATVQAGPMTGELGYPPEVQQTSSVSRAEVRAELAAAREAGPAFRGELDPQTLFAGGHSSDVTRAQVVQERELAREQGLITQGNLDYPPVQG